MTSARTLVAGIGNVFLGDDGFGVEVAARLSREALPAGADVVDVGIRARDLAFRLLDGGYDRAVLVDAVSRGGAPGTVYVIEPETPDGADGPAFDGHAMNLDAALALVRAYGGISTRILIVGCEPASLEESMGLSPPVIAAVPEAVTMVREMLWAERGGAGAAQVPGG